MMAVTEAAQGQHTVTKVALGSGTRWPGRCRNRGRGRPGGHHGGRLRSSQGGRLRSCTRGQLGAVAATTEGAPAALVEPVGSDTDPIRSLMPRPS